MPDWLSVRQYGGVECAAVIERFNADRMFRYWLCARHPLVPLFKPKAK